MISNETKEKWDNKIEAIIQACEMGIINLEEWQMSILDSCSIRRSKGFDLSHKQSKQLNIMYAKIN